MALEAGVRHQQVERHGGQVVGHGLAVHVARFVGVEVPANLVFAVAIVTLLAVCIQLSVGVSQLDERVRVLTEEVALLRLQAEGKSEDADVAEDGR